MLYGRLDDNNTIVEIIDLDPVGRYSADIKWVQIPDDFGLLTTKDKNTFLQEIASAQQNAYRSQEKLIVNTETRLFKYSEFINEQREIFAANGVDLDEVFRRSLLTQEERDAEDAAASETEST